MMINEKYSYNGYNPKSQTIKDKKVELKQKYILGLEITKLFYKTHKFEMDSLIYNLKNLVITQQDFNTNISIIRKELSQELINNDTLSFKMYSYECTKMKSPFKNKTFLDISASEFNNSEIIGTSFAQLNPNTKVFPDNVVGLVLTRCNCNNNKKHFGIIIKGGTHKQIKEQNDGEYWELDSELKPITPLNPERYDKFNLSKYPKDLSIKKLTESITMTAEREKIKQDRKDKILEIMSDPDKLKELIDSGEEL